jgi:hypothetical protein
MTLDPAKIDLPLTAILISVIALVISVASPLISFYVAWRDRARLKITCAIGPSAIWVTMVNVGRRTIILRSIGQTTQHRNMVLYAPLGEKTNGVQLNEHEQYVYIVTVRDGTEHDKGTLYAGELWVEDTLNNRHKIPCSKYLRTLREQRKQIAFGGPARST